MKLVPLSGQYKDAEFNFDKANDRAAEGRSENRTHDADVQDTRLTRRPRSFLLKKTASMLFRSVCPFPDLCCFLDLHCNVYLKFFFWHNSMYGIQ